MIRTRTLAILLALTLTGCANTRAYWSGASVRDISTIMLYRAQHKVLVFMPVPCAQVAPTKPAMVVEWVREKDIAEMVVVCDPDCNCKLVKGRVPVDTNAGICR